MASHDLQEPLGKIQIFTSILNAHQELPENLKNPAAKIGNAAHRMSMLIRDLLEFSRLLKSDSLVQEVMPDNIVRAIVGNFELTIQEKNVVLNFHPLPVIEAVGLQMNQLFYNRLGNALKFSRTGLCTLWHTVQRHIS